MKYDFKQGVITKTRSADTGSLYGVRVMPDMVNIPDTDIDLLPYYPNFFKEDHTAHQIGDAVWLLCNDDFHVGFILGQAQGASGDVVSTFIDIINDVESKASLPTSSYDQLTVIQYGGACITFHNIVTGASGTIYNNRIIVIYGADGSSWYNNPGLTAVINPTGELSITGKAKSETYTSTDLKVKADSTEHIGTKTINSDGKVTIQAGGTFEKHVASANTEWVGGDSSVNIVGAKYELLGAGESRTILLGGSSTNIAEGFYSINVGAGGITLSTLGPITLSGSAVAISAVSSLNLTAPTITMEAGLIALIAPLITATPQYVPMVLTAVTPYPPVGGFL